MYMYGVVVGFSFIMLLLVTTTQIAYNFFQHKIKEMDNVLSDLTLQTLSIRKFQSPLITPSNIIPNKSFGYLAFPKYVAQ